MFAFYHRSMVVVIFSWNRLVITHSGTHSIWLLVFTFHLHVLLLLLIQLTEVNHGMFHRFFFIHLSLCLCLSRLILFEFTTKKNSQILLSAMVFCGFSVCVCFFGKACRILELALITSHSPMSSAVSVCVMYLYIQVYFIFSQSRNKTNILRCLPFSPVHIQHFICRSNFRRYRVFQFYFFTFFR